MKALNRICYHSDFNWFANFKQAIVSASALPISIIIVGVGTADFSAMEELDGDTVRLSSRGRVAARDIVQFVELNRFQGQSSKVELAKEVLAEIPDQLVGYMKSANITPLNATAPPLPPTV